MVLHPLHPPIAPVRLPCPTANRLGEPGKSPKPPPVPHSPATTGPRRRGARGLRPSAGAPRPRHSGRRTTRSCWQGQGSGRWARRGGREPRGRSRGRRWGLGSTATGPAAGTGPAAPACAAGTASLTAPAARRHRDQRQWHRRPPSHPPALPSLLGHPWAARRPCRDLKQPGTRFLFKLLSGFIAVLCCWHCRSCSGPRAARAGPGAALCLQHFHGLQINLQTSGRASSSRPRAELQLRCGVAAARP